MYEDIITYKAQYEQSITQQYNLLKHDKHVLYILIL